MKKQMEEPQILQTAFIVEGLFGELETLGNERVFDQSENEQKFDAACNQTQNVLSGIEKEFGRAEMTRCADRVKFYLYGKDFHLGAQALSMLTEGK